MLFDHQKIQNPSSNGGPHTGKHRRRCYSVYHENRTSLTKLAHQFGYSTAYEVPSVRRRGWYGYKGDAHVIWDRFGYGDIAISDFLALVRGKPVAVPASYGKRMAQFDRIDIVSPRLFSNLYQADCRSKPSLRKSLRTAFDVVVHHVEAADGEIRSIAIRACDYPKVKDRWTALEEALEHGHQLPPFVLCAGSLETVLCYLDNDMLYDFRNEASLRKNLLNVTSRRWRVELWSADEWVRRIRTDSKTKTPSESRDITLLSEAVDQVADATKYIGGIEIKGSLVGAAPASPPFSAKPLVVMALELPSATDWRTLTNACGSGARILPVFSDDDIRETACESVRLSVPVIRQGTLATLAMPNTLKQANQAAKRHPSARPLHPDDEIRFDI